ncbi:MAG TPA: DUF2157 domain-containing protein [Terracidiphilus sp.]|jgi:uncharacterized membrane protein
MPEIESLLTRWQSAGVLDAVTAARIRAHEAGTSPASQASLREQGHQRQVDIAGVRWQGITALILGAILLACGVVLFVSAHWDQLGPGARFLLVIVMVAVFHKAGALARPKFRGLSSALHAIGTVSAGAAIALVGQIFNIQEHWPAAVLLWALCAVAGWALLRDQAQQTLALLLVPAWIFCELEFRMNRHIGEDVYMGRLCFVWAIFYITFFIGSRRKAVQGILFAVSVIGAVSGVAAMVWGWTSFWSGQSFIPFSTRVWAWVAIAAVPLVVAAFHGHKGLIPIAAAIAFVLALPWCYNTVTYSQGYPNGAKAAWVSNDPNLLAYALVAAFAVFLCWWGVRLVSRALVNLGIVSFAASVAWFYFSDILNKMNRSLGLIVLGVLFLAGGWALEKMRRRILARMDTVETPPHSVAAAANGEAR